MHIHTREDETFYVLAGEIEVTVGGERDVLRAGDSVFLPRGIPHRLENLTSQPADSGRSDAESRQRGQPARRSLRSVSSDTPVG
jgi:uncharacterized RmlC-like cupin family protein